MEINYRQTIKLNDIEYICYKNDDTDHLGILIQKFISDDEIKKIVSATEKTHEYIFLGIEINNNESYLLFTKDLSSE